MNEKVVTPLWLDWAYCMETNIKLYSYVSLINHNEWVHQNV
jgi:hypothetical protein